MKAQISLPIILFVLVIGLVVVSTQYSTVTTPQSQTAVRLSEYASACLDQSADVAVRHVLKMGGYSFSPLHSTLMWNEKTTEIFYGGSLKTQSKDQFLREIEKQTVIEMEECLSKSPEKITVTTPANVNAVSTTAGLSFSYQQNLNMANSQVGVLQTTVPVMFDELYGFYSEFSQLQFENRDAILVTDLNDLAIKYELKYELLLDGNKVVYNFMDSLYTLRIGVVYESWTNA